MMLHPKIAAEIFELRPDFTALSLSVTGGANRPSDAATGAVLAGAIAHLDAPWAEAHLDAWREAFRDFGAKPNRTPCSAEALRKRALRDGQIRATNAVVDLYNAVSLRFAVPVGGEDAAAYVSAPTLCRATGTERFETVAEGAPRIETPDVGEVIWADKDGVTCRRWNWRQGTRTQLTEASTDMWFVLERLGPMPVAALVEAGQTIAEGLLMLAPNAVVTALLFDRTHPDGNPVQLSV